MSKSIRIGNKFIGDDSPPFIIAEMSANHNNSLDRAIEIVEAAAKTGAHALKIQTYTADTMTIDIDHKEFKIDDNKSLWNNRSLYELYNEAHTPWEWHKPIFERSRELGMIPLSTPFDNSAVDLLESLDSELYKIASFENTDLQLIKRVALTGKPIIISTGMMSVSEMGETVETARNFGCKDIILLKCTSNYPASPENTDLLTIPHMKKMFGCQVGLSDHTMGVGASVASVALGASIIEKHFTLNRSDGGVDSAFSLEPSEMKSLVIESKRAWQALGGIKYGASKSEKPSLQFRRSLYIVKDIKAGEEITLENIRAIRPGYGLPTKHLNNLIGKTVNRDIARGTAVNWDFIG